MTQNAEPSGVLDTARPRTGGGREVMASVRVIAPLRPLPTVVLADAQPAIRHGVRSVLERSGDVQVVGEAGTMGDAITETSRRQPDVLVIDPLMDDPAGIGVITEILRVAPETGILVFSPVSDDTAFTAAIHAGARGYLIKSADSDQIVHGVHAVAIGQAIVDRSIANRLRALIRPAGRRYEYPFPQLTGREREVLERMAAGRSNAAIARELALAAKTVSNRVSAIFGKLGVVDRAQAIVQAREAGLGTG